MGSSPTKTSASKDSNVEAHERFQFRFTDCSCQCEASKKRADDVYRENDIPQAAFHSALMTQIGQSQYDLRKHLQNVHKELGNGMGNFRLQL